MKALLKFLLLIIFILPVPPAMAWDSVSHRLSAAVALDFLSADKRALLLRILRQHPRFDEDFLAQVPGFIDTGDDQQLAAWLLGQAAYWPDIARGLPAAEAEKYNRPAWHYIDGAWLRDAATMQGNSYIGIARFDDVRGEDRTTIHTEQQANNIVTALDYNTLVLADAGRPMPERAVALCWVLHLMGDIHQPLHAGSLFSAEVFKRGDRGGNGVRTDAGNLHARWDRALGAAGLVETLPIILQQLSAPAPPKIQGVESDWSQWLAESRQILLRDVYTKVMKQEIAAADRARRRLRPLTLSADYVSRMQEIARQRIGQAGLRLAIWFENELSANP